MQVWLVERITDGFVHSGKYGQFGDPNGKLKPKIYQKKGDAEGVITGLCSNEFSTTTQQRNVEKYGILYWKHPDYERNPEEDSWYGLSDESKEAYRAVRYRAAPYRLVKDG